MSEIWLWVIFNALTLAMIGIDLGIVHRKAHVVKAKEAAIWSAIWTVAAFLINIGVLYLLGRQRALEFFTGYLIERSLSIDNIFVFVLVFAYFKVPAEYQHL